MRTRRQGQPGRHQRGSDAEHHNARRLTHQHLVVTHFGEQPDGTGVHVQITQANSRELGLVSGMEVYVRPRDLKFFEQTTEDAAAVNYVI